ncbi:MAG: ion transporter [Eubacteriales bacterium]|nr:ion transporter [Eubacteriales bacterium]
MRKRIYRIIELSDGSDIWGTLYHYFMMIVIFASIVPLAFKRNAEVFSLIDKIAVVIFIIDYLLRLFTADLKYGSSGVSPFLRYPFSWMAIIDLLSILPSVASLNKGFRLLRIFRLTRAFRVFRIFRILRYSKSFKIITAVFRKQKAALLAVMTLALAYILISALVIYNVEPDSFDSFFTAAYWATVSLTTVGYGDIYPVSTMGQVITMISALFGVAVIALPAGIITAGYMNEMETSKEKDQAG